MKITTEHVITFEHLVWSAYSLRQRKERVTKKGVIKYLRAQIQMFGSEETSLMGENYLDRDIDETEKDREWVQHHFSTGRDT